MVRALHTPPACSSSWGQTQVCPHIPCDLCALWNRTLAKAQVAIADPGCSRCSARTLGWVQLASAVEPGDVVVSMLPADLHLTVARLCLAQRAHFVSSSYISEEMAALDEEARAGRLCFINECGLDPVEM